VSLVTLIAADCIAPRGPVQPGFFPEATTADALEEHVGVYLADATARVAAVASAFTAAGAALDTPTANDLALAWVAYRAWDAVLARLIADPASYTAQDQGSYGYTGTQVTAARDARDAALARYTGASVPPARSAATAALARPAQSGPARILW